MKAFLEEYGLVIVITIVVAMLIGVAVYVSQQGKTKMEATFNSFTTTGEGALSGAGVGGSGGVSGGGSGDGGSGGSGG